MSDIQYTNGYKYEIFIGLKDKDNYQEILSVNDFKRIIVEISTVHQIGFSLVTQLGGYTHGKGYTTETSLRVIIIGLEEDDVVRLGERLKKEINTDAIMITRTAVEYCFL